MKKVSLVFLFLLGTGAFLFAGAAKETPPAAKQGSTAFGLGLSVEPTTLKVSGEEYDYGYYDMAYKYKSKIIGLNLFTESKYVQFGMSYDFNSGDMAEVVEKDDYEESHTYYDGNVSYLGMSLLFKVPINAGFLTLSPLIGFEYQFCLKSEADGVAAEYDDLITLSDPYFLAGLEGDIAVSKNSFFRVQAVYALNCAPDFYASEEDPDLVNLDYKKHFGYRLKALVGYGFRY